MQEIINASFNDNKTNDFSSCQHIKRYLDSDGWCKKCALKNNKWTSGNVHVDKFIKKTQKKSSKWTDNFLEWIPFENFENKSLKKIGSGCFSNIYRATWLDGKRIKSINKSACARSSPITVVLKSIKNSANISEKYVKELEKYYKCTLVKSKKYSSHFVEIYGMTYDVKADEYMLVTQYSEFGNLRNFIKENRFSNISWSQKLWWLCDITSTLTTIHKEGLVHGNLHPGNILQIGDDVRETRSTLIDIGLSMPANDNFAGYNEALGDNEDEGFYGVLPYIAPEVLKGNKYTKESDLYSLGILMMELATGEPPFCNRSHDQALIKGICEDHLRPNFLENTPKKYKDLALHCTDPNPSVRPPARLLLYVFNDWWQATEKSQNFEIGRQFNSSNEFIKNMEDFKVELEPNAIYSSRQFDFTDYNNILIIDEVNVKSDNVSVSNSSGVDIRSRSDSTSSSGSSFDDDDDDIDDYYCYQPRYQDDDDEIFSSSSLVFHSNENNNFESKYLLDLTAPPKFNLNFEREKKNFDFM